MQNLSWRARLQSQQAKFMVELLVRYSALLQVVASCHGSPASANAMLQAMVATCCEGDSVGNSMWHGLLASKHVSLLAMVAACSEGRKSNISSLTASSEAVMLSKRLMVAPLFNSDFSETPSKKRRWLRESRQMEAA